MGWFLKDDVQFYSQKRGERMWEKGANKISSMGNPHDRNISIYSQSFTILQIFTSLSFCTLENANGIFASIQMVNSSNEKLWWGEMYDKFSVWIQVLFLSTPSFYFEIRTSKFSFGCYWLICAWDQPSGRLTVRFRPINKNIAVLLKMLLLKAKLPL